MKNVVTGLFIDECNNYINVASILLMTLFFIFGFVIFSKEKQTNENKQKIHLIHDKFYGNITSEADFFLDR